MGKMTAEQLKEELRYAFIKKDAFDKPIDLINYPIFNEPIKFVGNLIFNDEFDKYITLLPDNLSGGDLYLKNTNITSLPNNLSVSVLDLQDSNVTILSNDLSVEHLHLWHSKINHIPTTITGLKSIIVDEEFLPSISYDAFLICLNLFKNIISVYPKSYEFVNNQFEKRFLKGE